MPAWKPSAKLRPDSPSLTVFMDLRIRLFIQQLLNHGTDARLPVGSGTSSRYMSVV